MTNKDKLSVALAELYTCMKILDKERSECRVELVEGLIRAVNILADRKRFIQKQARETEEQN